jgi:hypothetical protein
MLHIGRWQKQLHSYYPCSSIPGFLFFSFQTAIQISRGADEREMSERLRKIPELFSGCTQFLRVQAERIGIAHEFFKQ